MCTESKKIQSTLGGESLGTNPEMPRVTELVSPVIIRRQGHGSDYKHTPWSYTLHMVKSVKPEGTRHQGAEKQFQWSQWHITETPKAEERERNPLKIKKPVQNRVQLQTHRPEKHNI